MHSGFGYASGIEKAYSRGKRAGIARPGSRTSARGFHIFCQDSSKGNPTGCSAFPPGRLQGRRSSCVSIRGRDDKHPLPHVRRACTAPGWSSDAPPRRGRSGSPGSATYQAKFRRRIYLSDWKESPRLNTFITPKTSPGEASASTTAHSRFFSSCAVFLGILSRDLLVPRRQLLPFLMHFWLQPLFFLFIFGVVLPVVGIAQHGYGTLLLPGIVALTIDRKSTRLNSSHTVISYAVFCLKQKN